MIELELDLPLIEEGWEVAILDSMNNSDGDVFPARDQGWHAFLVVRRSGQTDSAHVPSDSKILGGIKIQHLHTSQWVQTKWKV